jgi:L-ribulose-5-phosphate 3-epimerase
VAGEQSDPQQGRINMNRLKIGIRLESLGLPLRRALREAQRLGVRGVQADAAGDLSPGELSQTGRRAFRHLLRGYNLELTALGCPLRLGLDAAENQQPRLEHVRKVLDLSFDLGPRVAIVGAGAIPDEPDGLRRALLRESLLDLGRHGDRVGARLALETGLESGAALATLLQGLDTGGLGVNLDPANLLEHGFDPYDGARALRGRILHGHARDARGSGASRSAREVPLGQGDIDWVKFVAVLEEVGYRGWLTVERETGDNRLPEVAEGVALLRRLVG